MQNSKPILFSTPMVQAILAGRKTQTRRVVKITDKEHEYNIQYACRTKELVFKPLIDDVFKTAQYKKGDILYVRETFHPNDYEDIIFKADCPKHWTATDAVWGDIDTDSIERWKPSIHMPREYARIFLKVTDVRVERLHDIEDDTDNFLSEGYPDSYELKEPKRFYSNDMHGEVDYCDDCMIEWWETLWNSTSKDGYKWEDNPYVFVYEFERVDKEYVDALHLAMPADYEDLG